MSLVDNLPLYNLI